MFIRHLPIVLALALVAACGSSHEQVDATPVDTFGGATFGEHCATSQDCPGGLCIDAPTGSVCSTACTGVCPEGWNCRLHEIDGELQSICVPQQFDYCTACTEDEQCAGGVCVDIGGASACLAECPIHGTCPTGYTCGSDPSGQHVGSYCLPMTNTCSCTVAQQNQVRTCTKTNQLGTCRGIETCDADHGGWINCSAATPSPEICDGMDNDCNLLIDEGVGGSPCMNTVAGVGSCQGITRCQGSAGVTCEGKIPQVETCNYLDDNCNGTPDEGYPGLSSVCNVGVGACQRFGVTRCTSNGSATECSVTAGAPVAEKCNALDDDCDTKTDETFPTLGNSCTVGLGVCARTGNIVCNTAQTATVCSVMAGAAGPTDTCNGLDDDCDGKSDEGFKNQTTGLYDANNACGSCAIDCTVLYNLPNAAGTCTVSGTPTCGMVCNANAFNLDAAVANGCELILDTGGVYVSTDDVAAVDDTSCGLGPVGTGAGNHPCKTITQGIARANTLNRPRVLVANGVYSESVSLATGRSVLGGHRPDTWQRDVASTTTFISGAGTFATTNHDFTVQGVNITTATVFEGFVVVGSVNTKPGGNSYAIYVATSNGNLTIKNNTVVAGRGGPGVNGSVGANGSPGVNGTGRSSNPAGYDAIETTGHPCAATNNRQYANGGVKSCGANNVSGGNGGGNKCVPATLNAKFSAIDGAAGSAGSPTLGGAGGISGAGGFDMDLDMDATGEVCYLGGTTGWHDYGFNGGAGADGMNGPMAAGCSAAAGSVVGGHWVGGAGGAGVAGGNGGGGGGGGAGGGANCVNCTNNKDQFGGHGGGGGSGGCGGTGGGASSAGGGAFGIFIAGGTAPIITGNDIQRGQGAPGGTGGAAGAGASGGLGAEGGGIPTTLYCPGVAGSGGNGGDGGHGSGGGGACGGSSVGIYTSGIGMPTYCMAAANNTITGGAAGMGGAGGYSVVNTGGAGAAGTLLTCSFN